MVQETPLSSSNHSSWIGGKFSYAMDLAKMRRIETLCVIAKWSSCINVPFSGRLKATNATNKKCFSSVNEYFLEHTISYNDAMSVFGIGKSHSSNFYTSKWPFCHNTLWNYSSLFCAIYLHGPSNCMDNGQFQGAYNKNATTWLYSWLAVREEKNNHYRGLPNSTTEICPLSLTTTTFLSLTSFMLQTLLNRYCVEWYLTRINLRYHFIRSSGN